MKAICKQKKTCFCHIYYGSLHCYVYYKPEHGIASVKNSFYYIKRNDYDHAGHICSDRPLGLVGS
jgi:hypothetical protein